MFSCACDGTGYGGPTCTIVIIYFDYIPPITEGTSIPISLHTNAILNETLKVTVNVVGPSLKIRTVITLTETRTRDSETVNGNLGIVTVTLPKNSNSVIYEPRQRDIFISSGPRAEGDSYFEKMNLPRGQLKPSCCSTDELFTIACPGTTTQAVSLQSPCKWTETNAGIVRSVGSVFATTSKLSLPTSISGLRYRNVPDKKYNNEIRDTPSECKPCDECKDEVLGKIECTCYNHTQHDTQDFLTSRALAFTYIGEIQKLLPPWLEMLVDLDLALESSPLTSYDLFAPTTRPSDLVSSIDGCSKLTGLMNGIFSVLRHDKTLSAVIDGVQYDYREDANTGSAGDTMCFAVDLCHESGSPVHMQISQPINDILVSQYLRHLSSKQWSIHIDTVSVFNHAVPHSSTSKWNGREIVAPPELDMDLSLKAEVRAEFTDNNLQIRLDFRGSAVFDYKVLL